MFINVKDSYKSKLCKLKNILLKLKDGMYISGESCIEFVVGGGEEGS